MRFIETPLSGAYIVECDLFIDERGVFARTFCAKEFAQIGFDGHIVQINYSQTGKRGIIRGMHYQLPPVCEAKIVRCVQGKVFDVMVDIRTGSSTFNHWYGVELSSDNMLAAFVPKGFAHGYQALTDNAALIYFISAFYSPAHEKGLRYDDPALAITWPMPANAVSDKDRSHALIDEKFKGIEP
ncbi:MAG: dTDP-4-dehydrorhamnose 3,5-epimerase [Deltaproteobacteria bacterium]|nr:dTDP-4-dehydrorhamnose 3,5-epimerase [Deltaproteobacteria bacterium]